MGQADAFLQRQPVVPDTYSSLCQIASAGAAPKGPLIPEFSKKMQVFVAILPTTVLRPDWKYANL